MSDHGANEEVELSEDLDRRHTDRRSDGDRRKEDLGPPDNIEKRKGERRRSDRRKK